MRVSGEKKERVKKKETEIEEVVVMIVVPSRYASSKRLCSKFGMASSRSSHHHVNPWRSESK